MPRDTLGSPMRAEHAHWRVLSVGARLARAVENYKGWMDADLRHRESERERGMSLCCVSLLYALPSPQCSGSIILPHLCLLEFRDGLG